MVQRRVMLWKQKTESFEVNQAILTGTLKFRLLIGLQTYPIQFFEFLGPVNVPLVQLLPPKSSRAIRDVRPEHVETLKDDFSDVDLKANTIRLYGNVICDEDLKPSEIQSNISKRALKVEIIDGKMCFLSTIGLQTYHLEIYMLCFFRESSVRRAEKLD